MRIVGIDPGTRITGYGLITLKDGQIQLLETGIIETHPRDSIPIKLNKVYQNLDKIFEQYQPEIMVLEKLYSHYRHPTTAFILGHVRGVIALLCAQRNIQLIEQSVKRVRKALIGNGNATKQQIQGIVAHYLKIDRNHLTYDSADALALALGYAQFEKSIL